MALTFALLLALWPASAVPRSSSAAWLGFGSKQSQNARDSARLSFGAKSTTSVEMPYLEKLDMSSSAMSYYMENLHKDGSESAAKAPGQATTTSSSMHAGARARETALFDTHATAEDYLATLSHTRHTAGTQPVTTGKSRIIEMQPRGVQTAGSNTRYFLEVNDGLLAHQASSPSAPSQSDAQRNAPSATSNDYLSSIASSARRPDGDETAAKHRSDSMAPSDAVHNTQPSSVAAAGNSADYLSSLQAGRESASAPSAYTSSFDSRESVTDSGNSFGYASFTPDPPQANVFQSDYLDALRRSTPGTPAANGATHSWTSLQSSGRSTLSSPASNTVPFAAPSHDPAAQTATDYLSSIGGVRANPPASTGSYGISDDVTTRAPPVRLPGDYLSSMTAASVSVAPPSTSHSTSAAQNEPLAAPSSSNYLTSISRDNLQAPSSTSYGISDDVMTKAPPAPPGDYLSSVATKSMSAASSASNSAAAVRSTPSTARNPGDYLSHLKAESPPTRSSYGFSDDVVTTAPPAPTGDYLSSMHGASASAFSHPASFVQSAMSSSTAPAAGDYLSNIGNDAKPPSSRSYGFSDDAMTTAAADPPFGDYLSHIAAAQSMPSASSRSSLAPAATSAPATPGTGDYLSRISADTGLASTRSYGFSDDIMTKAPSAPPSDYLSSVATKSISATSGTLSSDPRATSSASAPFVSDYLAHIGRDSKLSPSRSYGFSSDDFATKAAHAQPGDYLSNMAAATPVSAASSTSPMGAAVATAPPAGGDYLSNIGRDSKPTSARSYGFSENDSLKAPPGPPGDYLSSMATQANPAASSMSYTAPTAASVPAVGDYLSSIDGGSTPPRSKSYGFSEDVMAKAPASPPGDYLSKMAGISSTASSPSATTAAPLPFPEAGAGDYLSRIGHESKSSFSRSYGFSDDITTTAPPSAGGDYLSSMATSAASGASIEVVAKKSMPSAPAAGDYLSNIGGDSNPPSSRSYGFSDDVMTKAPPAAPGDYLSSVAARTMAPASIAPHSTPAAMNMIPPPAGGDYLSSIGSDYKPPSSRSYGISDTVLTKEPTAPPGDYLSNVAAKSMAPNAIASQSAQATMNAISSPAAGDYLASIGGDSKPPASKSYGFSDAVMTKAPPAPPGDYLSSVAANNMARASTASQSAPPAANAISSPVAVGDYLASIGSDFRPPSSRSYGFSDTVVTKAPPAPPGDYLSSMGGNSMAPASITSQSAPTDTNAIPSPAAGDYLANIGGNSKPPSSRSYGFSDTVMTKAPPAPPGDYLSSVAGNNMAQAPITSQSAPTAANAISSPAAGDYLANIGGDSKPLSSRSYGFSDTFMTKAPPAPPGDYLSSVVGNNMAQASITSQSTPTATNAISSPASGDYLANIGGDSKPPSSRSYGFSDTVMTKAPPAPPGDYLSSVAGNNMAPASITSQSAPTATNAISSPAAGDYLANIGGDSKPPPLRSYGFSDTVMTKAPPAPPGDYLSSVAGNNMAPASITSQSTPTATNAISSPASGDYLANIGRDSKPPPSRSYGFSDTVMTKAPPAPPGDYLSSVAGNNIAPASIASQSTPTATNANSLPAAGDYLANIGGDSKPTFSRSYGFSSDVMTKAPPAPPGDYLSSVAGNNMAPASIASQSTPTATNANSLPAAGDYLANIGGDSKPTFSRSYGFSSDVMTKAPPAPPGDYLSSVAATTMAPWSSQSAPTGTNEIPPPVVGDYLANIGGESKPAPSKSYGFSNDVTTKAPAAPPGDYLSTMAIQSSSAASSSSPSVAPGAMSAPLPPQAGGDYLGGLEGVSKFPSSSTSYGFSDDVVTNAPPAPPGDYLESVTSKSMSSPPSTVHTSPASTIVPTTPAAGDYLSTVDSSSKLSSSTSYGFSNDVATTAPPALPGDYLSNMAASLPRSSTSYSAPGTTGAPAVRVETNHRAGIGGNLKVPSSASYGFSDNAVTTAAPALPGDYLASISGDSGSAGSSTAHSTPPTFAPAAPGTGDYLASIGTESKSAYASSFGLSSDDVLTDARSTAPGDYLSSVAGKTMNSASVSSSPTLASPLSATSAVDYLSRLARPKGNDESGSVDTTGTDYLSSLARANNAAQSIPQDSAKGAASATGEYLSSLGKETPKARTGGSGPQDYISSFSKSESSKQWSPFGAQKSRLHRLLRDVSSLVTKAASGNKKPPMLKVRNYTENTLASVTQIMLKLTPNASATPKVPGDPKFANVMGSLPKRNPRINNANGDYLSSLETTKVPPKTKRMRAASSQLGQDYISKLESGHVKRRPSPLAHVVSRVASKMNPFAIASVNYAKGLNRAEVKVFPNAEIDYLGSLAKPAPNLTMSSPATAASTDLDYLGSLAGPPSTTNAPNSTPPPSEGIDYLGSLAQSSPLPRLQAEQKNGGDYLAYIPRKSPVSSPAYLSGISSMSVQTFKSGPGDYLSAISSSSEASDDNLSAFHGTESNNNMTADASRRSVFAAVPAKLGATSVSFKRWTNAQQRQVQNWVSQLSREERVKPILGRLGIFGLAAVPVVSAFGLNVASAVFVAAIACDPQHRPNQAHQDDGAAPPPTSRDNRRDVLVAA